MWYMLSDFSPEVVLIRRGVVSYSVLINLYQLQTQIPQTGIPDIHGLRPRLAHQHRGPSRTASPDDVKLGKP